ERGSTSTPRKVGCGHLLRQAAVIVGVTRRSTMAAAATEMRCSARARLSTVLRRFGGSGLPRTLIAGIVRATTDESGPDAKLASGWSRQDAGTAAPKRPI
ncbi:hypothetical protein, partial [Candidatus Accumulibacter sp. ACC005]|uniref:hypothetical protein n=1 Tax=Candidatus Accumulibacter sp. ACC005 TaxID=2823331 RepID=UPI0025BB1942